VAVVVDVIRAFTTAAYAFAGGATTIYLVQTVQEALELGSVMPDALIVGEEHGRQPKGFHLPNSPATIAKADVAGRPLVQRTSAGTQGIAAVSHVEHVFAASLVCASATAAAVATLSPDPPTYVITGRFEETTDAGQDDLLTAKLIERARSGQPLEAEATAKAVAQSEEADRTLALGPPHVHPDDIILATKVDAFAFAMRVERVEGLQRLVTVPHTSTSRT
jgi:2-phosphosulfolactate phosphatase